ncbi:calretinin-like isoform X3 [Branchiostoma floridae]|uniref:Calretinin-like isoform X3 n=2 Tax=Branchiostoma TaxID=7737 RepID=A0A9J7MS25_BRAFL|nr:PREDICTED: calretinin-like isoform X3 [Branchiostoma belcheri]XP_035678782.1 calretinin-like isoform X3 [Branchiostoma floridae]
MAEGSAAFDGFLAKYTGDLTSAQFMEVWDHFDKDGNGFIEGKELDDFFRELARQKGGKQPSDQEISDMREAIMLKFDDNKDGRISMNEMSSILPMEESFLLLFRQQVGTSVEFMEIWRKYDADCSGYIESEELRSFLTDLLSKAGKDVTEDKLAEYVETILKMFDSNNDRKLELKEMAQLLPVKENFLTQFQIFEGSRVSREEFDKIFAHYDKDKSGTIEDSELCGLLKDLMEHGEKDQADWLGNDSLGFIKGLLGWLQKLKARLTNKELDAKVLEENKELLLKICDIDKDGRLSKDELAMLLCDAEL